MKTSKMVIACAFALSVAQAFAANTHMVTFRRLNGTVLMQTNVLHGANATSLAPAVPSETNMTSQSWDCAEKLACVTNDVTCWALYEASTAKSPSTSIASQSVVDRSIPYSLEEYFQIYDNLAWSDEFSGTELSVSSGWSSNGKNWGYDTSQRNNELQQYTQGGNHIVSDGTLKLECRRESSGVKSFTSGSIQSKNKVAFMYGRCEIRAKLTKQKGTWPAFWLMGQSGNWPNCGELDVFEQINGSEWIGGNFHLAKTSSKTISNSALVCPEDGTHWGDAFHRIGIIMTEFECVWYVDDHIFKRMDVRNKTRYPTTDNKYWYILLNLAFGGNWPGPLDPNDSSIADFTSEDFEVDYCRIFTNTTANRTITRESEPAGTKLTTPVNATVWRGWQMKWGKGGAYASGLDRSEAAFCKAAMTEYFTRDHADIVTFLTRPAENTGASDLTMPFNIPGVTSLFLSPEQGSNNNDWEGDIREKLLSGVLFNKERFSLSRSAIGSLPLSNDANYTNCSAVVAELVEKDSGAKVTVVSVNLSQTSGIDYDSLFNKLNQFKNERTILLFQSMASGYHSPLKSQASSKLDKAYTYLGEYKVWPTYQFSYATTNCVSATAANPAPLSVPKANGQASGVHTNQAYCATVQFESEPETVIEYGQLDKSAFAKKMDVTFSGYSGTALTDFPVLVKLSTAINGFSYSDFQKENGGDLRFADSTGKLLPHEIDTWNPSGVSTVWVKVPSLSASAKITACYGCDEPPAVAAKDVWDADYVGVWHLGESLLPMKESSATSVGFTQSSGSGIGFASQGIVGGSVDFGESGKTRALIAPDHNALDGFSQCTFEAWTYVDSTYRASGSDVNKGFLSKRINYNNQASYYLHDTGSATKFYISDNGTSSTEMSSVVKPDTDAWTHQAYTFDGTTSNDNVKGWKNGANVGTASKSVSSVFAGSANLVLGNFSATDARNYPGRIDELRISKVARSAAWIKASHDTVANADFATYSVHGAEPQPSDTQLDTDAYAKSMDISFGGYSGAALADFPVLVKLSTAISGFSYEDFTLPNGGDLRFADANGNLLSHEIDTWNTNGVSTVWVKVPSLTAASRIKAYYGCSGTPQPVSAKDVWDDGYVGVWHLGESAVPMKESSETTSDFTTTNGTGIAFASQGIVGGSVDFVNGSKCSVVAPDHDLLDGFEKFTIEVWTWQDAFGTNLGILSKRNTYMSEAAYYILQSGTQTPLYMQTNSTAASAWISAPFPEAQAWNHLAYAIDTTTTSGNVRSYKNGGTPSTSSKTFTGAMLSNGRDLVLGNLGKTAGNAFNGKIDEVRISNVVRSGDWIKATHDTIANDNFAAYAVDGAAPVEPDRVLYVNVAAGEATTLNAALVTEYITNIVKQGAGTLVASPISGYAGAFDIQGGVFQVSNAGDCGAAGAVINVRDGASLLFKGGANTVLDGKTVNLYGAKNSALRGKIQCETTNNQHLGSSFTLNLFSDATIYGYSVNYQLWPTSVDLNGYELVLAASGNWLTVRLGGEIADGGALTFSNSTYYVESTGATPSFSAIGASNSSLRLRAGAVMNCKQAVPSNGWTLDCGGSNIRGNMLRWPKETNVPVWDGPIVCSGASTIASYSNGSAVVSNTVFNAKGAFSGSGTLSVGPGWLNLHNSANTYSGAVTVTGMTADQTAAGHVGPGGGGIGLWNGAACFPNASSITFTNTARLAFMDNTACTVPNVTFVALAGETQSISGGVYTARSTIAGIVKEGAGTLIVDSPAQITGLADVQEGTLKVANRVAMGSTLDEIVVPQPVFSSLAFASGTALDLSGNYGFKVADLTGSPSVTNAGVFGVSGKWTLTNPGDVLNVAGENVVFGTDDISGMLAFASGATFDLSDESAFSNAVVAAGAEGLVVARARRMLGELSLLGMTLALPHPTASISENWEMRIGSDNQTLRLFLNSSASGYAAWIAEKDLTGDDAAFEKETNGIKNGIRYAFDIDPASSTVGDPIIKVVPDSNGNPVVEARNLADGRDDVAFGVLATENLNDWTGATLVPMKKFSDGLWKPTASESHTYVFPAQMFFKYKVDIK